MVVKCIDCSLPIEQDINASQGWGRPVLRCNGCRTVHRRKQHLEYKQKKRCATAAVADVKNDEGIIILYLIKFHSLS
jgi:predicted secreted protein